MAEAPATGQPLWTNDDIRAVFERAGCPEEFPVEDRILTLAEVLALLADSIRPEDDTLAAEIARMGTSGAMFVAADATSDQEG